MIYMLADMAMSQFKATMFLAGLGVLIIAVAVLLVMSFKAQARYDKEALPSLPGLDGEEIQEEEEEYLEELPSAFTFAEDEDLPPLKELQETESEDFLKATRAAQAVQVEAPKTTSFPNPFKR